MIKPLEFVSLQTPYTALFPSIPDIIISNTTSTHFIYCFPQASHFTCHDFPLMFFGECLSLTLVTMWL